MAVDERYMREALEQAYWAEQCGEIPVGALIVDQDGNVLSKAHNLCEKQQLPTAHAELLALEAACKEKGTWRLSDCTLYATLEPCPMCMGAIIHARVKRVVFGAFDPRAGACGSLIDLSEYPLESVPTVTGGVLGEECISPIRRFFRNTRAQK